MMSQVSAAHALANTAPYLSELVKAFTSPWAIAGGWALDLGLGPQTRMHSDVEIAILRRDQQEMFELLSSWRVVVISNGTEIALHNDKHIEPPLHEIHAHGPNGEELEVLLNECEDDDWVYRRDHSVRLPLKIAFVNAIPFNYLVPEAVLLYKSKSPTAKDEADFTQGLATLDENARAWLAKAIERTHPQHAWLRRLGHG